MIDYVNKDLFVTDGVHKKLIISYDGGTISNSHIHYEQFELTESLNSENQLKFGSCESSMIKLRIINPFDSLIGKELEVSLVLNGDEENPFKVGKYTVYSDKPSADRSYRDIVAYDYLYEILNLNVSDWYNGLFPDEDTGISLKAFRDAFFYYFGLEQEEISLVNDSMMVFKTIDGNQITGKLVLNAICEINGCFGQIGRTGKFKYVYLSDPSSGTNKKTLDLNEYRESPTYEDYTVQEISGLQIRTEENDVGVSVGTESNMYVIQDNFLVYGKGTEELESIAANIYEAVNFITYKPFSAKTWGDPTAEVGDLISVNTKSVIIDSYILKRVLGGIQSFVDTFTANGEEYYEENSNSILTEITKLKGKSNVLERTIEETKSTIVDVENGLKSNISQTAKEIRLEIDNIEIGARNLIRNSENLIYDDYYFIDPSLIVTDDGEGNVDVETSVVSVSDDEEGNVTLESEVYDISDDGSGEVLIEKISDELTAKGTEMKTLTMGGRTYEIVDEYARSEIVRLSNLPEKYTELPSDGVPLIDAMYFLGEVTEVSLSLPETADKGDMIYISFCSGEKIPSFNITTDNYIGLDVFTLQTGCFYELIGLWNGSKWVFVTNEVANE